MKSNLCGHRNPVVVFTVLALSPVLIVIIVSLLAICVTGTEPNWVLKINTAAYYYVIVCFIVLVLSLFVTIPMYKLVLRCKNKTKSVK